MDHDLHDEIIESYSILQNANEISSKLKFLCQHLILTLELNLAISDSPKQTPHYLVNLYISNSSLQLYQVLQFYILLQILQHLFKQYITIQISKMTTKIKNLDDQIGKFYQDNLEQKTKAAKNILELFQDFSNLEELLDHESLLQVLSRTLSQNHPKSIDLSVSILSVFYILSHYRQFQQYVTQHQIGKTIIDVLQNQIQRFDLLYSEYIQLWRKNEQKDKISAKAQLKKLNILIWKQDKLFFVCLLILFNISQNPAVEKKMRKVGIVNILTRCLQRNDFHLLIVSLVFLRKLTIIGQFKDQIVEANIISKLQRFFTCQNDVLLNIALLVYYNLSFDKNARDRIEKASLIPKFVNLLAQDSHHRMIVINIIYLLSTDVGIRYTLAYTNCMDYVFKMILFPNPNVDAVSLLALAINLSANERNTEHIAQQDFYKILDKAIKSQQSSLLKLCKNILKSSKNPEIHQGMKSVIKDKLVKMVMIKSKNQEMCLELYGIMSNSKIGKQWTDILLNNQKFIEYLGKIMISGVSQDDILLEIVMLISSICQEAQCCSLIEQLFEPILSLFLGKQYDPEFIGQLLHSMYSFVFHGVGLERILSQGEVLMKILELIDDPNEGVRQINDELLTILRETDDIQLAQNIKKSKFYRHNKKWLSETEGLSQWVYENDYDLNDEMLDPRMWESEDDYD